MYRTTYCTVLQSRIHARKTKEKGKDNLRYLRDRRDARRARRHCSQHYPPLKTVAALSDRIFHLPTRKGYQTP